MMTNNWLRLPTTVAATACQPYFFFRNSTRPAYSPMRLGVTTATAMPPSTDLNRTANPVGKNCLVRMWNLKVSRPRLRGTMTTVSTTSHNCGHCQRLPVSRRSVCHCPSENNCRHSTHSSSRVSGNLISKLIRLGEKKEEPLVFTLGKSVNV